MISTRDLLDEADNIANTSNYLETECELGDTIKAMKNSLIGHSHSNFDRDSELIMEIYMDIFKTLKYGNCMVIPTVSEIAYRVAEHNMDVYRIISELEYNTYEVYSEESYKKALHVCKEDYGLDPADEDELFISIYVEQEHETIVQMSGELFNEDSFRLSSTIEELIDEVLYSKGHIYLPSANSRWLITSYNGKMLSINGDDHSADEVIPVVNECQEVLIHPGIFMGVDANEDSEVKYLRKETNTVC